jgi:hypothetical protein
MLQFQNHDVDAMGLQLLHPAHNLLDPFHQEAKKGS